MFRPWYRDHEPRSEAWLHDLHRHPEIGFEEHRTADLVAGLLEEMGLEVRRGIGGTGVVGLLRGQGACGGRPRRIGIRAELDALPMAEQSGLPYASRHEGAFHGCGHDGHMVTALTAAAYLAAHPDFAGEALFIFQPAEELLRGARAMLDAGVLDDLPCDEVYALHNLPGLPAGHVAVPEGTAMASADDVDVTLSGAGTHGSAPHTGADTIMAAAAFMSMVQQAATRAIDARKAAVLSFGRIEAGTARNILPASAALQGTLRCGDAAARDRFAALLRQTASAIEAVHDVRIDLRITPVAPLALNAAACRDAVLASARRVVGAGRVIDRTPHLMASEDFAEFQARVPGAYFFIGQDGPYPHHPAYRFDPAIIPVGAEILVDLVRTRTTGHAPHPANSSEVN